MKMPYDEKLADGIRTILSDHSDKIIAKKMFVGLSSMFQGNLCCGVIHDELMVRVGPDEHDNMVAEPRRSDHGLHRPANGGIDRCRSGWNFPTGNAPKLDTAANGVCRIASAKVTLSSNK
jgi:hypothetical protein